MIHFLIIFSFNNFSYQYLPLITDIGIDLGEHLIIALCIRSSLNVFRVTLTTVEVIEDKQIPSE